MTVMTLRRRPARCAPWTLPALALACAAGLPTGPARAADPDPHAHHHHAAPAKAAWTRKTAEYRLPADLTVQRADGVRAKLGAELDDGRPVLVNFIYTTCTAICPVMTQTFVEVQAKLGADRDKVHMASFSIDPEQDTPKRLAAYAKKYGAGPQWSFYTGTVEASIAVQKAFDAYRGDKMNHQPVTFLRAAPGQPWLRLDGFATPDEVVKEYRQLMAGK
jgi:protein SCO1/2